MRSLLFTSSILALSSTASAQTITNRVATMSTDAQVHFEARFGPTPLILDPAAPDARRRPAVIEAHLQEILDDLAVGGCIATALPTGHFSGQYGPGRNQTGEDHEGPLAGLTIDRSSKTLGGTLADTVGFGTASGDFASYGGVRKLYADRADGGFVAGKWVRYRGRRGVFVGVTGTCASGTDPSDILDDWFGGGLPVKPTSLKLFYSDPVVYTGLGREHFDQQCQQQADAASMPGTFLAVVSDTTHPTDTSIVGRLTDGVEIRRPDGAIIANDLSELLFDAVPNTRLIQNRPNYDAFGVLQTNLSLIGELVLFGFDPLGSNPDASDCAGWTDVTGASGTTLIQASANAQFGSVHNQIGIGASTCPFVGANLDAGVFCVEI